MTREEFINDVTTWDELKDFCYDYSCDYCDDVYDDDGLNDYLNRAIEDWAGNMTWRQLRDRLDDIPTDGEWYSIDEYEDINELDDVDFEGYKRDVLSWVDDYGDVWDEEDDEDEEYIEDEEENTEDDEDDGVVEEPFSLLELYSSCHDDVTNALMEEEKREEESDNALVQLVGVDIAM